MENLNSSATGFSVPSIFNYSAEQASEYRKNSEKQQEFLTKKLVENPAAYLFAVGRLYHSEAVLCEAQKVDFCLSSKNLWEGKDIINRKSGELFTGDGRILPCRSKYCQRCQIEYCCEKHKVALAVVEEAERRKQELSKAVSEVTKNKAYLRWHFFTFTARKVSSRSSAESYSVFIRAFQILKKQRFYNKCVAASVRSIEFFNEDGKPFTHGHVLNLADFRGYRGELERAWRHSISKAWLERGISIEFEEGVKAVHSEYVSVEDLECKVNYVIKEQPFIKFNPEDIVEFTKIKRLRRIEISILKVKESSQSLPSLDSCLLNSARSPKNKLVSNSESRPKLKSLTKGMTHAELRHNLEQRLDKDRNFKKAILAHYQPYARFQSNGETWDGEKYKENN